MCGIFGWSYVDNKHRNKKAVIAAVLALTMDRRGGDSWGFYCPSRDEIHKGTGTFANHVAAQQAASFPIVIAHTRKATTGKVTAANAHPFTWKDRTIVGAHNGMVSNHWELNKEWGRSCSVDSEHLFLHYDDGLDLLDVEAYGAVEFTWKGSREVQLARFDDGELSCWTIKNFGTVWASTRAAVASALSLAGLTGTEMLVEQGMLYTAADGMLYDTGLPFQPSPYYSPPVSKGYKTWGWGNDYRSQTGAGL